MRVLGDDRGPDHRAVVRDEPSVVGREEGASASGHVLHPVDFDAPVIAVQPERDALDSRRELGIEAEFVASWLQLLAGTDHPEGSHHLEYGNMQSASTWHSICRPPPLNTSAGFS